MRKNCINFVIFLVLLGSIATSTDAAGYALQYNGAGDAVVGIDSLNIDGNLYDVSFTTNRGQSTYQNTWPDSAPVFLGNLAGAISAVEAICDALNAEGSPLVGVGNGYFYMPVEYNNDDDVKYIGGITSESLWILRSQGQMANGSIYSVLELAVFSSAAVPVPGAIWLMVSGLIGIAGVKRGTV